MIVILFINTGCQNTPAKASRYCAQHNRTAMTYQDDLQDEEKSTANEDNPGSLIVKIINNKTTRQGDIYEVVFHANQNNNVGVLSYYLFGKEHHSHTSIMTGCINCLLPIPRNL